MFAFRARVVNFVAYPSSCCHCMGIQESEVNLMVSGSRISNDFLQFTRYPNQLCHRESFTFDRDTKKLSSVNMMALFENGRLTVV